MLQYIFRILEILHLFWYELLYYYIFHEFDPDIDSLERKIIKCGTISVKICQWLSVKNIPDKYKPMLNRMCSVALHSARHAVPSIATATDLEFYRAGSIGYIYKGKFNGKPCIVKVIPRDLQNRLKIDIEIIKMVLMRSVSIFDSENLDNFFDMIYIQTDLLNEADNMIKFTDHMKDLRFVKIPEVYLATDEYLIMEYIDDAKSINEFPLEKRLEIQNDIAIIFLKMLLINLDLHGDMHPGNILIRENGAQIVLIDFGITYKLSIKYLKSVGMIVNFLMVRRYDMLIDHVLKFALYAADGVSESMKNDFKESVDAQIGFETFGLAIIYKYTQNGQLKLPSEVVYTIGMLLMIEKSHDGNKNGTPIMFGCQKIARSKELIDVFGYTIIQFLDSISYNKISRSIEMEKQSRS